VVRIRVVGDDGVAVIEASNLGDGFRPVQLDLRADEIPVEAVRELVAMDVNFCRLHDRKARRDGQEVHQVERSPVRGETEHEVGSSRDRQGSYLAGAQARNSAPMQRRNYTSTDCA